MEMNLLQKKKRLRGKLPDIQICLGIDRCFSSRLVFSTGIDARYDWTTTQISRERYKYGYEFSTCSQCLRQGNDSTDREGCALRYSLNMSAHATKLCLGLLVARCQCDAGVQLGRSWWLTSRKSEDRTDNTTKSRRGSGFLKVDIQPPTRRSFSECSSSSIDRDQITTTEVNMARLHNWAVKQKQQNKK